MYVFEGVNVVFSVLVEELWVMLFLLYGCSYTALTWSFVAETLRSRRE